MISLLRHTAQKIRFSIKDFFSECDQILRKLRIWSHVLEKSLMENFIFYADIKPNSWSCRFATLFKKINIYQERFRGDCLKLLTQLEHSWTTWLLLKVLQPKIFIFEKKTVKLSWDSSTCKQKVSRSFFFFSLWWWSFKTIPRISTYITHIRRTEVRYFSL